MKKSFFKFVHVFLMIAMIVWTFGPATAALATTGMTIGTDLPASITIGVQTPFTVSTVANNDINTMVLAHFTIPTAASVEYLEQDGKWYPLTNVYGPATGFPVMDRTSSFRATFSTTGTKTVTVDFQTLTGVSLASKDITTNVVPVVTPDTTPPSVTSVVASTPGTIVYTFDEAVQLMNSDKTEVITPDATTGYASSLHIYNFNEYLDHVKGTPAPATHGTITNAVLSPDNKTLTITYTGSLVNQNDTYYVVDAWGLNITDAVKNKVAQSENQKFTITGDSQAPSATVAYDVTTPTNGSVVATITPSETVVGGLTHTFIENGTYTFSFTDLAGNAGSVVATVSNIDKAIPVITVAPYMTTPTNQNITVTAVTDKGTLNADSHLFTANGSFDFIATDEAGNVTTQTVTISNIDKVAPVIAISNYDSTTPAKTLTVAALTNEGTLNDINHTFTNNGSFDFVATDEAGNVSTSTVTVTNIVDTDQTVPSDDGNVAISSSTPEVVISSSTQPLTINIAAGTDNATINYGTLITGGTGVIPQTTINTELADIAIPALTIVTSASTTWNGIMNAPRVTTIDLPATSGETKTLSSAIEVGFSGAKLSFSNAVKITMPGQANKRVGYTRNGEGFTEITTACTEDSQTWANANLGTDGDCKVNSGTNLVIWTKHFTTFATYTQTTNPVVSYGGGGGGSYVSYCSDVSYGDWGNAINGFQYRDITSQSPSYCSLTVSQQLAKSRTYVAEVIEPVVTTPEVTPVVTPITEPVKQVLGEKKYADGVLLKGANNKIYVVKGNALVHIPNLKELAKYSGPILKVSDDVITSFSQAAVLGVKKYADGTLLKANGDMKIYVIKDGKKVQIRTLAELRTHQGKTLTVEASELNNY